MPHIRGAPDDAQSHAMLYIASSGGKRNDFLHGGTMRRWRSHKMEASRPMITFMNIHGIVSRF